MTDYKNLIFEDKKKNIFLYIILLSIALFLKLDIIEKYTGDIFHFSGIFLMLITYIYKRKIGYLTTFLFTIVSIFIFNNTIFEVVYLIEIIFVCEFWKRKKLNVILIDLIYWIIVAILSVLTLKVIIPGINNYAFFDLLIIVMNSLVDIFIVEVIITYFIKGNIFKGKVNISIRDVSIHTISALILIPFTVNIYIDIYNSYEYIYNTNEQTSKDIYNMIECALEEWDENEILDLKMGNFIQVEILKNEIEKVIKDKDFTVYVNEKRNDEILFSTGSTEGDEDNIYQAISENSYKVTRLDKSNKNLEQSLDDDFLLYKSSLDEVELDIFIKTPMNIYKGRLVDEHISQVQFLLFFIFFILSYLMILNKVVFKNISLISSNTRNLPDKIKNSEKIKWPSSGVYELNTFIGYMERMSLEMGTIFTRLNKSQEELFKLAYYDSLTNLPNRLSFKKYLERISKEENAEFAVMLLDIDKFKSVNDTLGHTIGDELLIEVSKRLSTFISNELKVYRLGGDEFIVLVNSGDIAEINTVATNVIEAFRSDININGLYLNTNCSLGISMYPKDSIELEDIVTFADIAMYESKAKGVCIQEFFALEMKEKIERKVLIEKKLKKAIQKNKLSLYMQPKISCDGKTIAGYECLLRWDDEEIGTVYPDEFIEVAEESNLILDIDEWVINEGCRINKMLQDKNLAFITVSINISGKNFTKGNLIDSIRKNLEKYNLDPKYLKIEITESVLIEDIDLAIQNMEKLRGIGVKISMDDFGKGYSSLTQLIKLPIQELKIDRDFIQEVNKDTRKKNIVKLIVMTAKELGLSVVAEGVENDEERKYVIDSGCDEIQGYYYSRPLDEESFIKYVYERGKNSEKSF